jgi:hypothetical protein
METSLEGATFLGALSCDLSKFDSKRGQEQNEIIAGFVTELLCHGMLTFPIHTTDQTQPEFCP